MKSSWGDVALNYMIGTKFEQFRGELEDYHHFMYKPSKNKKATK
jgi:hypothetical protein